MSHPQFEGSYLGDDTRISPTARMECKICWHVYDPAEGCSVWQIPAGTPFSALPGEWRCPNCDGDRQQFMLLDDPGGSESPGRDDVAGQVEALERCFEIVARRDMAGVPVVNDRLAVKAVGFRRWQDRALGVLITPWFMNLILLPTDGAADAPVVGTKRLVEFPSGYYQFVQGHNDGLGSWEGCSLFSPMFEFKTMGEAVEVAEAVMTALFDKEIREGVAPTAEIRQRREAELAAAEAAEAAEAEGDEAAGEPAVASRRAVLFGTGADPVDPTS